MSRPVVQHDGFLVPNAATVSNPRMAEPDRIDFNTIAHALWGVIEGCEVTVSGRTASITGGIAIVNGILVHVTPTSTSLGTGGSQDRFDLIAVDQGGTVRVIIGQYSNDPVFPDPPKDVTVLAAIFAPATQSNFTENVVDKRKFLLKQLLTKIDSGEMLIRNANGTGNHYSVTGGGLMSWLGDTTLWRTAPGTLRVQSNLTVDDSLTVGGDFTAENLVARNKVKARNIEAGDYLPQTPSGAERFLEGAIFQEQTSGKIFARQNGEWQELATMSSTIPVGTVITSLEKPAVMEPKGWVALNGQVVTEATHPRLFTLDTLLRYVTSGTAEGHDRVMALPNLHALVPLVGFEGVGTVYRPMLPNGQPRSNNLVALTTANMPMHKHNVDSASGGGGTGQESQVGRSGSHNHEWAYKADSGPHVHNLYDPGHAHYGMGDDAPDMFFTTPTSFAIGTRWGGRNKIDGPIEDGTHTYSVEPVQWTGRATTGVHMEVWNPVDGEPNRADGQHQHVQYGGGDHSHDLRFDINAFAHDHAITEQDVGGNAAFDVAPVSFVLYAYVRS